MLNYQRVNVLLEDHPTIGPTRVDSEYNDMTSNRHLKVITKIKKKLTNPPSCWLLCWENLISFSISSGRAIKNLSPLVSLGGELHSPNQGLQVVYPSRQDVNEVIQLFQDAGGRSKLRCFHAANCYTGW